MCGSFFYVMSKFYFFLKTQLRKLFRDLEDGWMDGGGRRENEKYGNMEI